jgi:predicted lipoprotein
MSTQAEIPNGKPPRSRLSAYLWPAVALLLLVAMVLDTKVVRIGSKQDVRADAFSAEAYGKKAFPPIQAEIEKTAVDAKVLAAAIAEDKAAAGEKYGKPGSVGPIFPVRFSGVVGEGRAGIFAVAVEGLPEGLKVRVQTGPAINGTEVRDATGTVAFGQFTNQIEYQDAGSALNNEIKANVLAGLDRDKLTGKKVDVVGVFQLINPAGWLVTPVRVKTQ